jgi:hypothetical protein
MLHCNNDSGRNFVQWERQISGLPLFFAKLRDFGASLSIAPPDRRCHPVHHRCRRLIRFCSRRNGENPMELEDARIILEGCQYDS